ncbi:unnamed protein product, partial [marine sediment metagenome]
DEGNVFRKDVVLPSIPQDDALGNAPGREGGFFGVPQVIE